ncbi:MAG TPA: alpha/beta hydrolase-fold protein [Anaeromyxobacteraceae bacterium]|nr:alpha/beta hydrolase-fold protein [Anaeromyxobacteraceae bacterium]
MRGRLETVEIDAPSLLGNPLGDPPRRPLLVYLPPGYDGGTGRYPAAYFLHGFTGSGEGWRNVQAFAPTVPERLDALVADGSVPPALGVFPDGWTSLGGTQWIDAPAVGDYQTYLCREVVDLVDGRYRTVRGPGARALLGKSSGGYGALAMGRDRPDVFGHLASHAGDAGFEYCYLPDFPRAAASLLGTDPAAWLADARRRAAETKLRPEDHPTLNAIAMAAHYSPRPGQPLGLELPFEPRTARLRPEVWARWLEHDPARFVPANLAAFRRLATVFLDCGTRDEFHLRWGTRMVAESLEAGGVEVIHQEFEDGHRDVNYRYRASLQVILPRLSR